ncbi:hypothetical protein BU23DRAFT_570487 [Bimuria novae-zelandiae CBS 107.79]|uniref:Alcohol acetyltransferase n=1 Tax=Bimuria novae-zelandiae CBS 107.79 TaxID=1447943 RepID=A0A6A5V065_9PLEO|nr:hypothetical protein BU23DRAFT_570487 [Bimuria novae-zelandiae CBS 107.79]
MTDLQKLRPCSRLELYSTARHDLGLFTNIACAASYTNNSSEIPLKDLIYRALHVVIERLPMLSAVVLNEDKKDSEVYFARLQSIDLRTCVDFTERKPGIEDGAIYREYETVLEKQHDINFKGAVGTRPFWRLVVLHAPQDNSTFTAFWHFHHALGDGSCGPIFHHAILSELQTASSHPAPSVPVDPIVSSPSTPLLPPFEELHSHPISWPFFIRAILGSIFPSYLAPRVAKLWTGPPVSAPKPLPATKVQLLTLPASATTKLLQLSRANETTMQATLECCIATALLATLPAETCDKVIASGPISVRSLLTHKGKPIGDDEFVLALAEYTYMHTRASHSPTEIPWDEARAVRSVIQSELAKKGANNNVSLLRYVSDMHKYFTEKIGGERECSFELSNLGVLKAGAGGEDGWTLDQCIFSQTPNVTGPPFVCSAITGGDGCCVLAFSWLDGVMGEEMMRAVVKGVERQIEGLVQSG